MERQNRKIRRMVIISLMAAASVILAKTLKFPIFPAAPFLKMDAGEIPLVITTCILSTWDGLAALLLKELLSFLLFGTNPFGLAADFLACGVFLLVFSLIIRGRISPKGLLAGITAGALVRMAAAIPINLIILQLQYGSTAEAIWAQMIYIIPFNGLKCLLDGACLAVLFKQLQRLQHKAAPAKPRDADTATVMHP